MVLGLFLGMVKTFVLLRRLIVLINGLEMQWLGLLGGLDRRIVILFPSLGFVMLFVELKVRS